MLRKPTDLLLKGASLLALPAIAIAFSACEVKQTEEGEMPEVEVEGGNMPEFEVEGPEVKVEEKEIDIPDSITVPDIDIVTPEERRQGGNLEDTEVEMPEATPVDETPADTGM